jgi:hypothetical protein
MIRGIIVTPKNLPAAGEFGAGGREPPSGMPLYRERVPALRSGAYWQIRFVLSLPRRPCCCYRP